MYLEERQKDYKWILQASVAIVLFVICARLYVDLPVRPSVRYWIFLLGAFAVMFACAALLALWKEITDHMQWLHERRQIALATTPLVQLSDNLKNMHPEAVKVLNKFGVRTTWQVNINNYGERDWILVGTNVHFGLVEFILERSGNAMMPKRRLAEGSKKWDPDGLVTDREQYDEFELWMFSRLMVTRNHGEFHPAEFIPPWTPQKILEHLGLTGVQDLYRPVEDARKDLAAADLKAETSKQKAIPVEQQPGTNNVIDVDDIDMVAIAAENARYANKNQ